MLALDFINVGNGDSILIREMEGSTQKFALMIDFGHDRLVRNDHPTALDPRSQRIYAGDFLREIGVTHLDMALVTHMHTDHVGGLSRVLDAVTVGEFLATYFPPEDASALEPDAVENCPKSVRSMMTRLNLYAGAFRAYPERVEKKTLLTGTAPITMQLTDALTMDILFSEPSLYARQKELYDALFAGKVDTYALTQWEKALNMSSLRQRLYYHGREIVLGGDAYAHLWEPESLTPCDILKIPHHATLNSTSRKLLKSLHPQKAVVTVAARRPDEQPHPYIISLIQEYVPEVYFTDAVEFPGLVEPQFHKSVHLEVE